MLMNTIALPQPIYQKLLQKSSQIRQKPEEIVSSLILQFLGEGTQQTHQQISAFMADDTLTTQERQEWHQLSEKSLNRLWDNEQDAVYDNWRELYEIPEG